MNALHTWQNTPIHVLDFEGTLQEGIVEYGVVTLFNGNIQRTHTALCSPVQNIQSPFLKKNGLTMGTLRDKNSFQARWDLFSTLRQTGMLAAHNASVEDGLIRSIWPLHPQSPSWINNTFCTTWGPWLDTYGLSKNILQKAPSHSLKDLVALLHLQEALDTVSSHYCPIKRRTWHNALYDALGAALILNSLVAYAYPETAYLWELFEKSTLSHVRQNELRQGKFF